MDLGILNSTISRNIKQQKKYKELKLLLRVSLRKTVTFKKLDISINRRCAILIAITIRVIRVIFLKLHSFIQKMHQLFCYYVNINESKNL